MAEPARAKPKPTPETQHFWDGTKAGELRLQRQESVQLIPQLERRAHLGHELTARGAHALDFLHGRGDLLVRWVASDALERRPLLPALAQPSWLDPATGGPRR